MSEAPTTDQVTPDDQPRLKIDNHRCANYRLARLQARATTDYQRVSVPSGHAGRAPARYGLRPRSDLAVELALFLSTLRVDGRTQHRPP